MSAPKAFQTGNGYAGSILRGGLKKTFALAAMAMLTACSSFSFGPDINTTRVGQAPGTTALPVTAGENIGSGPVRVAMILPLSGDASLTSVGTSMANGARLAMEFIAQNPSVSENISLTIKDSGGDDGTAAARASEAVTEGASLIIGPLRAEAVLSAGATARAAGVPLIGFSNNTGAASPGVYLLNVLPETEVRRSLAYAQSQGRRSFAAIISDTAYGKIQEGAFRQAAADLGLQVRAIYNYTPGESGEAQARQAVEQVLPLLQTGTVDALFIPDRATAPSFGVLFEAAAIDRTTLTIIGSIDWQGDLQISQTPYLVGAIYPSVDPAGLAALKPEYEAKFGTTPHPLVTNAYTAVLLANSPALSQAVPPYGRAQLAGPAGFRGRDGQFRFLPDGRSEFALTMNQVVIGGAQQIDAARLP